MRGDPALQQQEGRAVGGRGLRPQRVGAGQEPARQRRDAVLVRIEPGLHELALGEVGVGVAAEERWHQQQGHDPDGQDPGQPARVALHPVEDVVTEDEPRLEHQRDPAQHGDARQDLPGGRGPQGAHDSPVQQRRGGRQPAHARVRRGPSDTCPAGPAGCSGRGSRGRAAPRSPSTSPRGATLVRRQPGGSSRPSSPAWPRARRAGRARSHQMRCPRATDGSTGAASPAVEPVPARLRLSPMTAPLLTTAQLRASVQGTLDDFLAEKAVLLAEISPELVEMTTWLEALMRGGKRLRPSFCAWAYVGAGGADLDAGLRAAAALEMVQACALVHDDVMDGSDRRRGIPTAHRRFASMHRRGGLARRPGAVRGGGGDPARGPLPGLGRRAAVPLRAGRRDAAARQAGLRPDARRGDGRAVPGPPGAGPGGRLPGAGAARGPLQVRQVHGRTAAAPRGAAGRGRARPAGPTVRLRAAAGRGLPAARRRARRLRGSRR